MGDFFSFRRMITPVIIQTLFWIFTAIAVLGGLVLLFRGGSGTLLGLIWIVVGPLIARVYCEILIVIFRINETLTDIRTNTSPNRAVAPPSPPPPAPEAAG
jgi:uncharacterized protein DUF4282